jgi:SAM-dependent methyltransferase
MTTTTLDHPELSSDARSGQALLAPPRSREDVASFFESIYSDAAGDPSRVPWADGRANPMLVSWLNKVAPGMVRPGGRVAVVGCGLGHDAVELLRRGFDVCAFDIAPRAVEWARRLHPEAAETFLVADALEPPTRLRHRFDLVVECYTLQSVPPALRHDMIQGISTLLGPHGVLLTICRARCASVPLASVEGPPYPLCCSEMESLAREAGLAPAHPISEFDDDETPPVRRLRAAFRRA